MYVFRVPSSKNPVVPSDEDLQCCADLAAYYSKARDNGKVDVIVALAANLKKPKGAKPGQVRTVYGGKLHLGASSGGDRLVEDICPCTLTPEAGEDEAREGPLGTPRVLSARLCWCRKA